MSTYTATVTWARPAGAVFKDNKYSRAHEWRFDGGVTVPESSSPKVVPLPLSKQDAVDPEEAFVAALASCHMLFFLFYAAKAGLVIERYEDQAVGEIGKNAQGAAYGGVEKRGGRRVSRDVRCRMNDVGECSWRPRERPDIAGHHGKRFI